MLRQIDTKLLEVITRLQNLLENVKNIFSVYKKLGVDNVFFHFSISRRRHFGFHDAI